MDRPRATAASPPPAAAGEDVVLSARGVTKVYGDGPLAVHALRGVDLDLRRGELLVLLGASGSGKSTLLHILGALDVPTDGTVRHGDLDLTRADDDTLTRFRRDHVGFVFQFYNLVPSLTARENVELVTDIARAPLDPDQALGMVGLAARRAHFPAQMSGGEQQRVAIARAVAKQPEILLCDEPTGALDVATGVLVLRALADVTERLGTATALITHNVAIAAIAHRVISLSEGRISDERRNRVRAAPEDLRW